MKRFLLIWMTLFEFYSIAQGQTAKTSPRDPPPTKIQGVVIDADSSTRDSEKDTAELEGHVQIIYGDQHLSADRALVNFRSKSVDASGSVTIVSTKATIGGDRVIMDLETNTGIIYHGYVQSGSVSFEGKTLFKMSDTEFIADDAKYTTCTNCKETWSFTGSKIRAQLGGYAYIKNAVLRIGDFPIFPMPYMIVPLKSDRQSGFLTPDYEHSTEGGSAIGESYFWAINRSQDATIALKNYELRGLKSIVNYRYALSEHGGGNLDMGVLQDRAFPYDARMETFENPHGQLSAVNRWFLKYNHYQDLPDGFVHRVQFSNAADLQYPNDFPLETMNNGDPAMESRMSISQTKENIFWMADASYYNNLMQSNPLAGNDDSVQRLPELRLAQGLERMGDSDFLYSWDVDMANFARGSNYAFDSLNQPYNPSVMAGGGTRYLNSTANGIPIPSGQTSVCGGPNWETQPYCNEYHNATFVPGTDLIRTGQRVDGQIGIERPFRMGPLDLVPKISYRETDYTFQTTPQPSATRKYIRTELTARTEFNQIYNTNSEERIKHEIQPEVTASALPWLSQPDHPFFAGSARTAPFSVQDNISDSNLNSPYGLQFDYFDRNYDIDIITFGLTNRLIRKSFENGHPIYRQFFSWRIAQSYDFYQAAGNPPYQPYSDTVSELNLTLKNLSINQRIDYFPYQAATNSSSKLRVLDDHGDFIQFGYDLSYNIVPGQPVIPSLRTEQYSFEVKKSLKALDLLGKIIFDVNPPVATPNQYINSYGLGTQFRLPGDCWFIKFIYYRPTGGSDTFNFAFDFSFDGQPRAGLPESLLDTFSF